MKQYLAFLCVTLFMAGCQFAPEGVEHILIKGSDTEVNLALSLAETYMAKDSMVSIAVTGGGSGMGIAALINGKTDIANSSRAMKPKEIELAEALGIDPTPIVFAVDALALVVHPELPVGELSVAEVGQIYRGEIQNWQAVGGPDLTITIYGRQSNSGTYVFFRDSVLQADYASSLMQMNGTAQIVEALRTDRSGIGYVGLGYVLDKQRNAVEGISILNIQSTSDSTALSPINVDNIRNGAYPLVRPLFQFTDGPPAGKLLDFILFCLSPEGQRIVENSGYYPLSPRYRKYNKQWLDE